MPAPVASVTEHDGKQDEPHDEGIECDRDRDAESLALSIIVALGSHEIEVGVAVLRAFCNLGSVREWARVGASPRFQNRVPRPRRARSRDLAGQGT